MCMANIYDQGQSSAKKTQIHLYSLLNNRQLFSKAGKLLMFEQICEDIMYNLKMYAFTVYFAVQK